MLKEKRYLNTSSITVIGDLNMEEYSLGEQTYILDIAYCQDNFLEYYDSPDKFEGGAYMIFYMEGGKPYVKVNYELNTPEISNEEILDLMDYTQGQWSDGIGEGYEQRPCCELPNGDEAYLSPWHREQKLAVLIKYT